MQFNQKLTILRKIYNLTQKQLAKNLGQDLSKIKEWENNLYTPAPYEIIFIANYFNVTPKFLLWGEN